MECFYCWSITLRLVRWTVPEVCFSLPFGCDADQFKDWLFLVLDITFIGNIIVRIIGLTWANFIKSKWDLYALLSIGGTFVTTLLLLAGYAAPMFIQLQKLFLVSVSWSCALARPGLAHFHSVNWHGYIYRWLLC